MANFPQAEFAQEKTKHLLHPLGDIKHWNLLTVFVGQGKCAVMKSAN